MLPTDPGRGGHAEPCVLCNASRGALTTKGTALVEGIMTDSLLLSFFRLSL